MWLCWVPGTFHSGVHTSLLWKAKPWHMKGYCRRKHRKEERQISSLESAKKAEIVGSCTEKMKKMKKRKEDLNGSKPAERYKGEKQCRHETLPAAFHRPGTANLSQEVKQRKGVKWVRAKRAHGGRDAFYLWQGQSTELTSACGSVTPAGFWVPLERHSRDVDGAGWGNVAWDWQKQLCHLCPQAARVKQGGERALAARSASCKACQCRPPCNR